MTILIQYINHIQVHKWITMKYHLMAFTLKWLHSNFNCAPFEDPFLLCNQLSVKDPWVLTETRWKSSISVLTINNVENQKQSSLKILGPTVTHTHTHTHTQIQALTRDQCQAGISYFSNKAQGNTKTIGINLHSIVFNGEFRAQDEKTITAHILWLCIAFSIEIEMRRWEFPRDFSFIFQYVSRSDKKRNLCWMFLSQIRF